MASHVDHAGQLAQVESVIARGVDYVFLGPTEYEAAIPALRKLKQAEVPVVVYNFMAPQDSRVAGFSDSPPKREKRNRGLGRHRAQGGKDPVPAQTPIPCRTRFSGLGEEVPSGGCGQRPEI